MSVLLQTETDVRRRSRRTRSHSRLAPHPSVRSHRCMDPCCTHWGRLPQTTLHIVRFEDQRLLLSSRYFELIRLALPHSVLESAGGSRATSPYSLCDIDCQKMGASCSDLAGSTVLRQPQSPRLWLTRKIAVAVRTVRFRV
jgi:hypothetical protein